MSTVEVIIIILSIIYFGSKGSKFFERWYSLREKEIRLKEHELALNHKYPKLIEFKDAEAMVVNIAKEEIPKVRSKLDEAKGELSRAENSGSDEEIKNAKSVVEDKERTINVLKEELVEWKKRKEGLREGLYG